ncbi:MAG: hypothetical protein JWP74_1982 [Marmoricola sp.]|nr:hypothetical protein [Marmoricola sp.]
MKQNVKYGVHQLRRLVPASALPGIVRRRVDKLWENDDFRALQEAQMRELLEFTDRAPEIPVLARRFAEEMMLRTHIRWHPRLALRQPVRGAEWLTTKRDPARSVVISFMHHNHYEGLFNSLDRVGAHCHVMALPAVLQTGLDAGMKQHIDIVKTGSTAFPASGGTDALAARMKPGMNMAIASDVPGRTPITFLGRKVLGSFGAARIATMTNSLVVPVTAHQDGDGTGYLQVHPSLEPADFADPTDLLAEMIRIQEGPILAWPEVVDHPRARFGRVEG